MKRTWEDINSLDPIPTCSCGALELFTYQFLKRLLDKDTHTKLIHFLMGLNSAYEGVKTTVLTMDPLPTMNKTLGMLQQIQRQKQLNDNIEALGDAAAFVANKPQSYRKDSGESSWKRPKFDKDDKMFKKCSHCHKRGHTGEECYKLQACSYCHAF
ncbi:hypothetical protein RND81_03G062700 [Saponaria officinalis]|uniref:Polyprotein n=1 Tax=Saponaria officinalis TaxID=3572 RepID=A0AAW1M604_SAPOF